MTDEKKKELIDNLVKRLKSFLWRTAMVGAALLVDFVFENLTQFNLSPYLTVLIGLVFGEISKWLNSQPKPETPVVAPGV